MAERETPIACPSTAELAALDILQTPVWIFDLDRLAIGWANRAAVSLWRAENLAALQARDFSDMPGAMRDRLTELRRRFAAGERVVERWTLFPGGDPVETTCACRGVLLEDGRLAMLIEADDPMALDTARGADSMRLATFTLDRAPSMVVWIRADGTIFYANSQAATLTRYSRDELLGLRLQELDAEVDGPLAWPDFWDELKRARSTKREALLETAEGMPVAVEITAAYIAYAGGEYACVIVSDITQRHLALHAMRSSEERFQDFAAVASDWFWETDPEGRLTLHSGSDHSMVPRSFPTQLLESQGPFRDVARPVLMDDGRQMVMAVSGRPRFDANDRFLGYRGTARDITEMQRAEEALVAARDQAELVNRIKSEFLAIVSHELRTPLNAIIGFSDVMRQELFGALNERYKIYVNHINDSGDHLLRVINDILDLSKIEAGKLELHESAVNLTAAVQTCVSLLTERAREAKISLDYPTQPSAYLKGDEIKLKQITLNLISNAIKFTEPGGTIRVEVMMRAEDGAIALSVADTGIGMDEDEIKIAMEPFRQVNSARSRLHQGTGLGLPLAQSFAELHGGTLTVESEKGVGTRVTILMPPERTLSGEKAEKRRDVG